MYLNNNKITNNLTEEKMAYQITDDCVQCGVCADECPSSAIKEGSDKYVIDQDTCTECGTCVDACPSEAIIEK
jgi:ferredoxin